MSEGGLGLGGNREPRQTKTSRGPPTFILSPAARAEAVCSARCGRLELGLIKVRSKNKARASFKVRVAAPSLFPIALSKFQVKVGSRGEGGIVFNNNSVIVIALFVCFLNVDLVFSSQSGARTSQ